MNFKMRKPSYSEIYMYKNIFWVAIALFLFVPLLNSIPLALVINETKDNMAYPENMSYVTGIIQAVLAFTSTYGGMGILAICVAYFGRNAKGVIRLSLLSTAIMYFLLYLMDPLINPYAMNDEEGRLITFIVDVAVNTAVIAVVYALVLWYSKRKGTFMNIPEYELNFGMLKHPYSKVFFIAGGVQFFVALVVEVITMAQLFMDKSTGLPETTADYVYWILQYVYLLLYAVIGFIVMVAIGLLASKLRESGKMKFSKNQGMKM